VINKVGIIHHPTRKKALALVDVFRNVFHTESIEVSFILPLEDWQVLDLTALPKVDLLVSIGGDGTLIRVSHLLLNAMLTVPIWPIAAGEFNFMPDRIDVSKVHDAVQKLKLGSIEKWQRPVMEISTTTDEKKSLFINDVVFVKDKPLDILDISVFIEDEIVGTVKGDGIVVATSAGSTAYSLSAGGPIVDSIAPVYVVSMLNPHHITIRPIVVSMGRKTKICINGKPWHLLVDGLSDTYFDSKRCLQVTLAEGISLVYIHVDGYYSWIDNIRSKFHWGSRYVESDNS